MGQDKIGDITFSVVDGNYVAEWRGARYYFHDKQSMLESMLTHVQLRLKQTEQANQRFIEELIRKINSEVDDKQNFLYDIAMKVSGESLFPCNKQSMTNWAHKKMSEYR